MRKQLLQKGLYFLPCIRFLFHRKKCCQLKRIMPDFRHVIAILIITLMLCFNSADLLLQRSLQCGIIRIGSHNISVIGRIGCRNYCSVIYRQGQSDDDHAKRQQHHNGKYRQQDQKQPVAFLSPDECLYCPFPAFFPADGNLSPQCADQAVLQIFCLTSLCRTITFSDFLFLNPF